MLVDYSDRLFDIIYVMMDTFNLSERKAVSYLNSRHKEMLRSFAMSNYNTFYYENRTTNPTGDNWSKITSVTLLIHGSEF